MLQKLDLEGCFFIVTPVAKHLLKNVRFRNEIFLAKYVRKYLQKIRFRLLFFLAKHAAKVLLKKIG